MITALFNLADAIIECGRSTPNLRQALALIAGLICAKPNAKHLAMVMQLNQKVGQLQVTLGLFDHKSLLFQLAVIEILLEILNVSPFEPAECLLFPQTLHDDLYAPRKDSNSPLQRTFSKVRNHLGEFFILFFKNFFKIFCVG